MPVQDDRCGPVLAPITDVELDRVGREPLDQPRELRRGTQREAHGDCLLPRHPQVLVRDPASPVPWIVGVHGRVVTNLLSHGVRVDLLVVVFQRELLDRCGFPCSGPQKLGTNSSVVTKTPQLPP